MTTNSLQRADALVVEKHNCPICGEQDHNWQQVYTENITQLNKIEKVHTSWCNQQNDYVLITKIDT